MDTDNEQNPKLKIQKTGKMGSKKVYKPIYVIFLYLTLLMLGGCPLMGDRVQFPVEVKNSPNTFRTSPVVKYEKIISVVILDGNDSKVLWKIVSVEPVLTKDFIVTAGIVPERFKQVIPEANKPFLLVAGKLYYIAIETDAGNDVDKASNSWIAK